MSATDDDEEKQNTLPTFARQLVDIAYRARQLEHEFDQLMTQLRHAKHQIADMEIRFTELEKRLHDLESSSQTNS